MQKLKFPSDELLRTILNKQLEKYNITIDDVKDNQYIDGKVWYEHYTLTMEETEKFKEWCINLLRKGVRPKLSEKTIRKEFAMLDLMYGLKIE